MAETGAVFGGEHSAHYYFRDFWRADSGMLAALHVLAALGEQDAPAVGADGRVRALRRVRRDQLDGRRPGRGDARRCEQRYAAEPASSVDELDGLTVALPDGSWFNLRAVQHRAAAAAQRRGGRRRRAMAALRDEVLAVVRA